MKSERLKKIDAMHAQFGVLPDERCENCSNLIKGYCGNTFVRKCVVYGATHSEASDWRKKYVACGMFNKEWNGRRIMDLCRGQPTKETNEPIDGQVSLDI